jgi:Coenzyme PQQ synthesis protein D (PqqD)
VSSVSPAIRSTRTPDGYVLLDIERGRMFCLNPVASRIFDLLQQGLCEDRIVAQIAADYTVAFETAEADVHQFLESLARHHILDDRQASQHGEKRGNP